MSEKNPTEEDQQVRLHPEQLEAILIAILMGDDRGTSAMGYARKLAKEIIADAKEIKQ